jgi:hypothetical protein
MSRVEQPKYELVERAGLIEIRNCPDMIVAEAKVSGEREPAIQEGFRLIAAYIDIALQEQPRAAGVRPFHRKGEDYRHQHDRMSCSWNPPCLKRLKLQGYNIWRSQIEA